MNSKKFIPAVMFLGISIFATSGIVSAAGENTLSFDSVKAKQELAAKADQEWASQKSASLTKSTTNVDELLAKLTSEDVPPAEIENQLKPYGIYHLETPDTDSDAKSLAVGTPDMAMSTPDIYYDSSKSEWVVVGGGHWTTSNWLQHVPSIWNNGKIGTTRDVGGSEGFGVGYTNKGGTYSTKVVSSYGYISDGEGHQVATNVRSDGNGQFGFGFRLQDYLYKKVNDAIYLPATTAKFSYVGKHFAGLSRYDSKFSAYSGLATSYYYHTYDKTGLDSVTFSVAGATAGVEAVYSNKGSQFNAFSSDTRY